ncbi:aspartate aminotransferase family protein [Oceanirhabdus sp. W0125-5]|uniref:aspartate aminotransferase family protein n=1 Tax=Oceanirhabdus sp. W0125-5 TaxID=2999116 RepID=UPI0022F2F190|nr:aspartate aminotransferase family protein [Oceanirhabdus sp. W0125-5]WBW95695.1 aspartate aminotransferase family protein [Oceanirhabdus sp. W0125-5]
MAESNLMNTYNRFDVEFIKGKGTKLYDKKGYEYLDFVSGVAVNCLGHSHPAISKTLLEQGEKLIHISNLYYNDKQNALAEKLTSLSDHQKVFFCNSGTEAVEGAIKVARKYGKVNGGEDKNKIIYMKNSFHGRTMGALSITGQPKYQNSFKPLIGGTVEAEFNNIDDIKEKIDCNTCAVIIEPIQGEGGIIDAEKDFLEELRKLCDDNDALLIFDEVQCGIGRLGTLFAYQKFGVTPDIICSAKGLGGGFPIGAVIANEKAADVISPGDHGSTFGGNPLACAVSLTVINELFEGNILKEVDKKGEYLKNKLKALKETYSFIDNITGKGLLIGLKVNIDIKKIISKCFEYKFLVIGAGKNVLRLLPPLNVSYEELDQGVKILNDVLFDLTNYK